MDEMQQDALVPATPGTLTYKDLGITPKKITMASLLSTSGTSVWVVTTWGQLLRNPLLVELDLADSRFPDLNLVAY